MMDVATLPLTPADCDLRDFAFMPLLIARLRRSKAWLMAKRQPELGFYMINLWTAAWHDFPAASLEDDDDVLADLAMCDPKRWKAVREKALHGWVKCTDGRLYHPVVAEQANHSWDERQGYRERLAKARAAKAQKQLQITNSPTAEAITEAIIPPSTEPIIDHEIALKGQGQGQGQGQGEKKEVFRPTDGAKAPVLDPQAVLWRDGLATIRSLTHLADGPARKLLGRLVDAAGKDHERLSALISRAEVEQPDDPTAWLMAGAKARAAPSLFPPPRPVPSETNPTGRPTSVMTGTF